MSCCLVLGSELNGSFSSWSGPHIKTLIEKSKGTYEVKPRPGSVECLPQNPGSARDLRGEGLHEARLGGGAMPGTLLTLWNVFKARWTREHLYLFSAVLRCHWSVSFWSTVQILFHGNVRRHKIKCVSLLQDFYEPSRCSYLLWFTVNLQ